MLVFLSFYFPSVLLGVIPAFTLALFSRRGFSFSPAFPAVVALFDATQTMVNKLPDGKTQVQVVSWYDNENSYVSQMCRTIKHFSTLL